VILGRKTIRLSCYFFTNKQS